MFWQTLVGALAVGIIAFHFYRSLTMGRRVTALWESGAEAFEKQAFDEARRAFARIVKLSPSSAAPRRMLARALVALNRLDEAEPLFRLAADLEPRNGDGRLELGMFLALHRPGLADEAFAAIEQAFTLDPNLRNAMASWPLPPQLRDNPRLRALLETTQ